MVFIPVYHTGTPYEVNGFKLLKLFKLLDLVFVFTTMVLTRISRTDWKIVVRGPDQDSYWQFTQLGKCAIFKHPRV